MGETLVNEHDYIQKLIKTLNFPNYDEKAMVGKYRCKIKEAQTKNVSNWTEHFDQFKKNTF